MKRSSHEELVYIAGWVDGLKLSHNISFRKVSSEARAVKSETTTEWLNAVCPTVREEYSNSYIFNADETGVFFD